MADPDHIPELDGFDRFTVRLYRSGLVLASLGVALVAGLAGFGHDTQPAWPVVLGGTALSVANMHLYDKRVRWVIGAATHVGAFLLVTGFVADVLLLRQAGLGFVYVSLSAFALKEQFCFRIPGLRLVPLFLATSLIPLVFGVPAATALLSGLAMFPLTVLSLAKWRMPLHFDVGNKAHYQI